MFLFKMADSVSLGVTRCSYKAISLRNEGNHIKKIKSSGNNLLELQLGCLHIVILSVFPQFSTQYSKLNTVIL